MKCVGLVFVSLLVACGGSVDSETTDAGRDASTTDVSTIDTHVSAEDTFVSRDTTPVEDADPDAWVTGEYRGNYRTGFESSDFRVGGPCSWSETAYFLTAEDPTFGDQLKKAGFEPLAGSGFLVFEGRLSPPGAYGPIGSYPRQIIVTKLISASPLPPC